MMDFLLSSLFLQFISILPILLFTNFNDMIDICFSLIILLNSGLRINYPSSYYPLTQIKRGLLYSPYMARFLANLAEFIFYYEQTKIFTTAYNIPLILTILGELFCWLYLLKQKAQFGFYEDCIWFILQLYFLIFSNNNFKYLISLPYLSYMLIYHLPETYRQIDYKAKPNLNITISKPNNYNLRWITLSLFFKQICYGFFLFINHYNLSFANSIR